ncbi:MAG: NAD(P)-dependent oxidoreductase [Acetobacterium woodii]|nr:NAD(P)-dependent oxidoreductase [Acetobacterium woodii]
MRALVTGGFGFIGSFLCKELLQDGWKIRILDIEDKSKDNIEFDGFDYIIGDIVDYTTMLETTKDVDLIIHLAAKHRFFGVSKDEFYRVNVEGTKAILKAAGQKGIKNIIFYSTVAVYGDQTIPTDENTLPQPDNTYGITKLEAERLVSMWVLESVDRSALIIRPTVVFGPRNRGNMYRLIRQIDKRLFIPIGDGKNIKSVAYVENLVKATSFLINKGFKGLEVYNYADEPHMSFKETVGFIYRFLGRSAPKISLPAKPILTSLMPFDLVSKISGTNFPITAAIKKMNRLTYHRADKIREAGFQQIYSFEEGLMRMIEWYRNNREAKGMKREMDE